LETFVPAWGLRNPDAQTLFAYWLRPRALVPGVVRERWETPDGDFLDVDRLPGAPAAPHVLVLHGLEGSTRSGYVQALLKGAATYGWGATALNFRSCSGEPNRIARSYSSGETDDPRWVLHQLRNEHGIQGPLVAVGFSLGANALLKLLAEDGEQSLLSAAVAVSTPFDLSVCSKWLDTRSGIGTLYRESFLRSLKQKALGKATRFPEQLDIRAIRKARTLEAFDDAVTAPLYGFANAQDYYRDASAGFRLEGIRRPTLLLSSKDDPVVPRSVLPAELHNPHLSETWTERGGHVGFLTGSLWRPGFWAEARSLDFLRETLGFAAPTDLSLS
jgi:predicted alpha/beta-fold hydrolase